MKYDLGSIETRLAEKARGKLALPSDPLQDIEDALERLDNGEFGYCAACGEPIAISALRDDPTISKCGACSGN